MASHKRDSLSSSRPQYPSSLTNPSPETIDISIPYGEESPLLLDLVTFEPVFTSSRPIGAKVKHIDPSLEKYSQTLQVGDVLLEINCQPVKTASFPFIIDRIRTSFQTDAPAPGTQHAKPGNDGYDGSGGISSSRLTLSFSRGGRRGTSGSLPVSRFKSETHGTPLLQLMHEQNLGHKRFARSRLRTSPLFGNAKPKSGQTELKSAGGDGIVTGMGTRNANESISPTIEGSAMEENVKYFAEEATKARSGSVGSVGKMSKLVTNAAGTTPPLESQNLHLNHRTPPEPPESTSKRRHYQLPMERFVKSPQFVSPSSQSFSREEVLHSIFSPAVGGYPGVLDGKPDQSLSLCSDMSSEGSEIDATKSAPTLSFQLDRQMQQYLSQSNDSCDITTKTANVLPPIPESTEEPSPLGSNANTKYKGPPMGVSLGKLDSSSNFGGSDQKGKQLELVIGYDDKKQSDSFDTSAASQSISTETYRGPSNQRVDATDSKEEQSPVDLAPRRRSPAHSMNSELSSHADELKSSPGNSFSLFMSPLSEATSGVMGSSPPPESLSLRKLSPRALPVEMLDFEFITKCESVDALRLLISHLTSEGNPVQYPTLLRNAKDRLAIIEKQKHQTCMESLNLSRSLQEESWQDCLSSTQIEDESEARCHSFSNCQSAKKIVSVKESPNSSVKEDSILSSPQFWEDIRDEMKDGQPLESSDYLSSPSCSKNVLQELPPPTEALITDDEVDKVTESASQHGPPKHNSLMTKDDDKENVPQCRPSDFMHRATGDFHVQKKCSPIQSKSTTVSGLEEELSTALASQSLLTSEMEAAIKQKDAVESELSSQVSKLTNKLRDLEVIMSMQKDTYSSKIRALETAKCSAEQDVGVLEDAVLEASETVDNISSQLRTCSNEVEHLKEDLRLQREKTSKAVDEAKRERSHFKNQVAMLTKKLAIEEEKAKNIYHVLEKEAKQKFERMVDAKNSEIAALTSKLDEAHAKAAKLAKQHEDMSQTLRELDRKCRHSKQYEEALITKAAVAVDEAAKFKQLYNQMFVQATSAESAAEAMANALAKSEADLLEMQRTAQQECSTLAREKLELEASTEQMKKDISRYRTIAHKQKIKLRQKLKEIEAAPAHPAKWEKTEAEYQSQIQALVAKVDSRNDLAHRYEKALKEKTVETEKLESAVKKLEEQVSKNGGAPRSIPRRRVEQDLPHVVPQKKIGKNDKENAPPARKVSPISSGGKFSPPRVSPLSNNSKTAQHSKKIAQAPQSSRDVSHNTDKHCSAYRFAGVRSNGDRAVLREKLRRARGMK